MQLRRLASLERKKIEEEYKEVTALIKELEGLLRSPKRMRQVVGDELLVIKQTYTDRRRTQIFSMKEGDSVKTLLTTTDITQAQVVWVGVTLDGKIGRLIGDTLPETMPRHLLRVSTHETLYLASTQGQAAAVAVHVLPEVNNFEAGAPLYKACALDNEDQLAFLFHLPQNTAEEGERYILTCSRQGMLKKTNVSDLPGPSAQRFVLAKINNVDELLSGMVTGGSDHLVLITAQGMGIRFSEEEVRPMGLVAAGVMGIKLGEGDAVAGMVSWSEKAELFLLATDGNGWRVNAKEFPKQGRYGQGVIACRVAKGAELIGLAIGSSKTMLMASMLKSGLRKIRFTDASLVKRGGKSSIVLKVKGGDEPTGLMTVDLGSVKPTDGGAVTRKKPANSNGDKPAPRDAVKKEVQAKPVRTEKGQPTSTASPVRNQAGQAASPTNKPKTDGGVKATRKKVAEIVPPLKPAASKKTGTAASTAVGAVNKPAKQAAAQVKAPTVRKGRPPSTEAAAPAVKPSASKPPARKPPAGKPTTAKKVEGNMASVTPEVEQPADRKRKPKADQPAGKAPAETTPVSKAKAVQPTDQKPAEKKKPTTAQAGEQQLLPGLDADQPKPRKGKSTT